MPTLCKSKIRKIVSEQLRRHIDGKSYWKDKIFISFGTDKFDRSSVKPVDYDRMARLLNKPKGGLWVSPIDSKFGWSDFLDRDNFSLHTLGRHFVFRLSGSADIFVIDKRSDIYGWVDGRSVDFKRIASEFDGVYLTYNGLCDLGGVCSRDFEGFGTWDVESLCVWNPDVIVPIEEDAFEKAAVSKKEYKEPDEFDWYMGDSDPYSGSRKPLQVQHDMEMYGNQNVHSDMGKFFKGGKHPAILAQGHGNNKETRKARSFDGTLKSGIGQ